MFQNLEKSEEQNLECFHEWLVNTPSYSDIFFRYNM